MRSYCTYFDRNYAARAITLIESLNSFVRDYCFYALCLDDDSQRIMETLELHQVVSIPLTDLELFDLELTATKPERNLIDYYLTITPCLLRYLFENHCGINQLTYLDVDRGLG